MTIDIDQYQRLKKRVDAAAQEASRAEGALEQHMAKLKEDFDVDSIEEAEVLLIKFEKEEKESEAEYNKIMKAFEEKWGEVL